jgi:hypothetical protein
MASGDPTKYNLSDLRMINKNKVMRLANELGAKWGTLMITVQNPSNTKRLHLNFKYVKADRMRVREIAEKMVRGVRFR